MGRLISNLALTPPRLTATVSITMKPLTIAVLLLSSLCAQNCFAAPTTTTRKEAAVPELTYHESWSAEHRAMLTKLHRLIKKDVDDSMLAVAAAMHEFEDRTPYPNPQWHLLGREPLGDNANLILQIHQKENRRRNGDSFCD